MKSTEFCYWLQGLFELGSPTELDAKQTDLIRRHLSMVFLHDIDPKYPQKAALDAIHNPIPVDEIPSWPSMPAAGVGMPHGTKMRC